MLTIHSRCRYQSHCLLLSNHPRTTMDVVLIGCKVLPLELFLISILSRFKAFAEWLRDRGGVLARGDFGDCSSEIAATAKYSRNTHNRDRVIEDAPQTTLSMFLFTSGKEFLNCRANW